MSLLAELVEVVIFRFDRRPDPALIPGRLTTGRRRSDHRA
ncbi:hypothetical protein LY71_1099 [Geodermatophilus tzadiensis]|uniref:Uncharacterized protein n=1 Tax=Geodermatophilus tzadiensis TaxID=1137988 RepID=A0A2T0TRM6_9ACTN|nr:hypothetical protein LY71_1099 [Geodermatophilus tzadiensis]